MEYTSLSDYCKETFGEKLYKLSLDSGCTCPNRDGLLDTRGCLFCSAGGSGDFAAARNPLDRQLEEAKRRIRNKFPEGDSEEGRYIAYVQSFTGSAASTGCGSVIWHSSRGPKSGCCPSPLGRTVWGRKPWTC